MAKEAKHILVARTQGPEAGLEAYLAAPSSKIHDAYKEIIRKRTQASKLKTYCNLFGDRIGTVQTPVQADKAIGDIQALAQRITALLKGEDDEPEVVEPQYSAKIMALAEATGADPALLAQIMGEGTIEGEDDDEDSEPPLVTSDTFITSDVAWAVLGMGVPRPVESRRGGHASNAQLWRMNGGNGEFVPVFSNEEVERINALALNA